MAGEADLLAWLEWLGRIAIALPAAWSVPVPLRLDITNKADAPASITAEPPMIT